LIDGLLKIDQTVIANALAPSVDEADAILASHGYVERELAAA